MKVRIFLISLLVALVAAACAIVCACSEHEHRFDDEHYDEQEATCTENGVRYYHCLDNDGGVRGEIIPASHKFSEDAEVIFPTCTEEGKVILTCTVCGDTVTETVPATGHVMGEWETVSERTCTDDGVEGSFCQKCDYYESKTYPALGHDYREAEVGRQPTCTTSGILLMRCANDKNHCYIVPIVPLGHTFGEWETTVEPGCSYPGKEERECSVCGTSDERGLVSVNHSYAEGVCTECGRRDWTAKEFFDIGDPDLYNSDYSYFALGEEEHGVEKQTLYHTLDVAARAYHDGDTASDGLLGTYRCDTFGLTLEEGVSVWKAYRDDHPLYYWINYTLWYEEKSSTFTFTADRDYRDLQVRLKYNNLIYSTVAEWRKDAPDNVYLASLYFHDIIVNAVDYAYQADGVTASNESWAHNIISVFDNKGAAVCEGYSRTFQLLLNAMGIENRFVTGWSGTTAHAWNLVKLDDGKWYWFDLTFDDSPDWLLGTKYNYFAVSDRQDVKWSDGDYTTTFGNFYSDHTPHTGSGLEYLAALPECSATPYEGMGEVKMRDTFTVGEFTYTPIGYNVVQLIACTASGDVYIPETVTYGGITYEVASIGAMNEGGLFSSRNTYCVFTLGRIKTLFIPRTIRFMWETARPAGVISVSNNDYINDHSSIEEYSVDRRNQYFESYDGVLFTKGMYTLIAYPTYSDRTEYAIPHDVVYLAQSAFEIGCKLERIILGENLVSAGNINNGYGWKSDASHGNDDFAMDWGTTFYYCESLKEITVFEANENFSVQDGILYNYDKTVLFGAIDGDLTEAVIPSSVISIESRAFYKCSGITRIVFQGDLIKSIGAATFSKCEGVKEIVFAGTENQWNEVEKLQDWNRGFAKNEYTMTFLGIEEPDPDENQE